MEVVFQPGLEGLGERLLAGKRGKAARSSETVWDAYMRKRKCVPCHKTTTHSRSPIAFFPEQDEREVFIRAACACSAV